MQVTRVSLTARVLLQAGWSPLQVAVENKHPSTVEALLKAGAEVNCSSEVGRIPFLRASTLAA